MKVLVRTNDLVRLSFLEAVLRAERIDCVVLDGHTSGVEGGISAIPRRLAVDADDWPAAVAVLRDLGEMPDGG